MAREWFDDALESDYFSAVGVYNFDIFNELDIGPCVCTYYISLCFRYIIFLISQTTVQSLMSWTKISGVSFHLATHMLSLFWKLLFPSIPVLQLIILYLRHLCSGLTGQVWALRKWNLRPLQKQFHGLEEAGFIAFSAPWFCHLWL